ncbi:aspartate/glutamate racemase family protein [Flavobacterium sp. GT3P67]|uniref:aspartate/glutamate racemase family protein n=1 Tax=Flavobacterium sp. GT3P67 TaxID=2541722 RepID=UPI001043B843|nr:aspartate/glutamate racemase family protein [Flavobacterium sp. GT3P67]TDE50122.1 aspartate/glutamate racemase family protein [Flavobacterium sp. GT3P67]
MKTLGLIGGISWVSTADYYKFINEGINERLGGVNFAKCIIHSFNYADIVKNNNDWETTFNMLSGACENLKQSGAEAIVLCANTMHLLADRIEQKVNIPVIHIATETAKEIKKSNLSKVGLLGTKFTMELDFFTSKLSNQNIETIIPELEDRDFIHETIYHELGKGIIDINTKKRYINIIEKLIENGAEGIILGCTEIPLLIQQEDIAVPIFDTALIHSAAAVEFALS